MTINPALREDVRRRAQFACEFCGIHEIDAGGELTIDHYQPKSKGGDDSLDNLIYCCFRCNQYKLDYWPEHADHPSLWNPRREPALQHFLEIDEGTLHPLTTIGAFTIERLRLNRLSLVAHRIRKHQQIQQAHLLADYRDYTRFIETLVSQQAMAISEQQKLSDFLRKLLLLFLGGKNND